MPPRIAFGDLKIAYKEFRKPIHSISLEKEKQKNEMAENIVWMYDYWL